MPMEWRISWRSDPIAQAMADRHYSRKTPGAAQFMPPGRCLVLVAEDKSAVWGTSWPRYVQHQWPGAWVNTLFRNEGRHLSSDLIVQAVAATKSWWPKTPDLGMITFVDPTQIRHKRDPGRCYRRAGFTEVGKTKGGLIVLQLLPVYMPNARPPLHVQTQADLDYLAPLPET